MPATLTLNIIRENLFSIFKYTVYILLTINIFVFFHEEYNAVKFTHTGGISLQQVIEGFPATIDTLVWVILLWLFELETSVLSDDKLTTAVKRLLHGVRALCYLFILYAFYGYIKKCLLMYGVVPVDVTNLCALVDNASSFIVDLDEYVLLDQANCSTLPVTADMYQLIGHTIYSDSDTLLAVQRLAWTDVFNAGAWILVVVVLEIDIRLQLHGLLPGPAVYASKGVKAVLYSILLIAAVYWGIAGDFIDFWDAFLWIVAFVFIELNVFEWTAETAETAPVS